MGVTGAHPITDATESRLHPSRSLLRRDPESTSADIEEEWGGERERESEMERERDG